MGMEHIPGAVHVTVHLRKMGTNMTTGTVFPHQCPVNRKSLKEQEEISKHVFECEKQDPTYRQQNIYQCLLPVASSSRMVNGLVACMAEDLFYP